MDLQKSFEEAAFELLKTLCPEKNLKREEIPYHMVKDIVAKHMGTLDHGKKQLLAARLKGVMKQGPSDEKDNPVGSSSDKPISLSECRMRLLAERHHLLPKLEDFNEAQKIHLKYPKNVRKYVRARTERRLAAETNDFVNIVSDEKNLAETFASVYNRILRRRTTSLECYHVILNSLHHYFMRTIWSDIVTEKMDEFIRNHVISSCNDLTAKYDREDRRVDMYERLREYELMVLLELYLIRKNPEKIEETEVLHKLHFVVFIGDSLHLIRFLDGVVCDLFAHIIPKALVYLFEELCVKLPPELEDPSAETGTGGMPESREVERRSSRRSGPGIATLLAMERKALMKEAGEEKRHDRRKFEEFSTKPERAKTKSGLLAKVLKAERISKRIAAREKNKTAEEEKEEETEKEEEEEEEESSSNTISEGEDLGEIIVPSTPKSKMKKKSDEKIADKNGDEIIMQTPISKLARVPKPRDEKLAALSNKAMRKIHMLQQSRRKNYAALTRGARTQLHKPRSLLPASSPSTSNPASTLSQTRPARVNLTERFASMANQPNPETKPRAATAPIVTAAKASPAPPQPTVKEITLDGDIVERYRKRIETARLSAHKGDEVFYGRCTSRRNLFDDYDNGDEEETDRMAAHSDSCIQKNRSGRSVQTSQKVYMAHALLNVYNTDPLNPPKLPKDASFKLQRLIRPASKSDKKRLSKFRMRIAREKSSSASVKSITPPEIPGTAIPPNSQKLKSKSFERKLSNGSTPEKSNYLSKNIPANGNSPEKSGEFPKEMPKNGSSAEKSKKKSENGSSPGEAGDLFKEPSPKKWTRKSSGMSKNVEANVGSPNGSPQKNYGRIGRKSSNSSNGISNKSNTSDSTATNGSSSCLESSKSSNGALDSFADSVEDSADSMAIPKRRKKTSSGSA